MFVSTLSQKIVAALAVIGAPTVMGRAVPGDVETMRESLQDAGEFPLQCSTPETWSSASRG